MYPWIPFFGSLFERRFGPLLRTFIRVRLLTAIPFVVGPARFITFPPLPSSSFAPLHFNWTDSCRECARRADIPSYTSGKQVLIGRFHYYNLTFGAIGNYFAWLHIARNVLVPDLGADRTWRLAYDCHAGTLTVVGQVEYAPGSGPRHIALVPLSALPPAPPRPTSPSLNALEMTATLVHAPVAHRKFFVHDSRTHEHPYRAQLTATPRRAHAPELDVERPAPPGRTPRKSTRVRAHGRWTNRQLVGAVPVRYEQEVNDPSTAGDTLAIFSSTIQQSFVCCGGAHGSATAARRRNHGRG